MAKLSFYKTIDRSQLGGKFVPLIKSGVSNYKILASDLGKEYHPGDAIEITDTGEINVNYDPSTLRLSSFGLGVRTDHSRGVFDGADGIYITSADSSIGISVDGIKVNTESLIGPGLELHAGNMITVKTKAPLSVDRDGLELLIGGAGLRIVSGCLYLDSSVVSHTASDAVYYYMSTRTGSSLSIDQDYLVVNTNYIASAGLTTGFGNYNPISVDVKYVANAIGNTYIGSGLYWDNNNYTLSANVNTATGIIVNDNKLYLNAGNGLQTTNNTVNVKAADGTIDVSSSGIKVNTGSGLFTLPDGLSVHYYTVDNGLFEGSGNIRHASGDYFYASATVLAGRGLIATGDWDAELNVQPADGFIKVGSEGVGLNYHNLLSSLTNEYGGSANIKSAGSYLYTAIGDGLRLGSNSAIYVKSADSSIDVSSSGISVNPGYSLSSTSVGLEVNPSNNTLIVNSGGVSVNTSYLAGYGLSSVSNSLEVKPADDTITVGPDGVGVNKSALSIPTASSLVGSGLTSKGSYLYVQSADGSIGVGVDGIKVNAASGLETTSSGLYVKSADNTITVGSDGIKVNTLALAGGGLAEHVDGGSLQVLPSDSTISVSSSGVSVNYGLSLTKDASGRLISALYAGSGVRLKNNYISLHTGDGLEINDNGAVYVKSADGSIGVGVDGIKVLGYGLSAMEYGLAVKVANSTISLNNDGIWVNARYGLSAKSNGLYVNPADNTIDVSRAGIKVNTSALPIPTAYSLAGDGLIAYDNGGTMVHVLPADNTIDVSRAGIKVNTSALPIPTAYSLAGDGLVSNTEGKLDINYGPGLALDTTSSIVYVDYGSGLGVDSSGKLYVTSSSTPDIGKGLWIASDNNDLLSVYAGSGLGFSQYDNSLEVKTVDKSIDVTDYGIRVKTDDNQGVFVGNHGVYIRSSDSSISLSTAGIKVNTHSVGGIGVTDKHGLYIKLHTEGCLKITEQHGLSVKLASHSGLALGEHGLYLASGSHGVSSDAICIPYGGPGVSNAYAIGAHSIAIGYSAHASHPGSTVIGTYARGIFDNTTVVGFKALAHGHYSTAVGHRSIVLDLYSSAFGSHSYVNAKYCLSAGFGSVSTGDRSVSLGFAAAAQAASSIAIGSESNAVSAYAVAIGPLSSVGTVGNYSVSIGYKVYAGSGASIAIGSTAKAYHESSIAIGHGSVSHGYASVAIGNTSKAYSESSVVIGDLSYTLSAHSIAIGRMSYTYAGSAIAIGPYSIANGSRSIAIGSESYANSSSTIAIGYSSASGAYSVAIGAGSSAPNTYCLSAGYMSSATGSESVALGVNSDASSFGIAIGSQSNASQYGLAIGYNASALDGMVSIRTSHSDGRCFDYKYDCEGKLYATDTSGGTYTRSWENLITPPDLSTKTTINSGTTYTADKPLWIGGSGYSGGGLLLAEFYINGVYVGCVSASNNNSDAFIVPVAKGDTYKINLTHNGGQTPKFFRMDCQ